MHLVQVQEALEDIAGVRTVAVMPGSVELLAAIRDHLGLHIPLLSDPDWALHRRYALKRGSRRDIFFSMATWKAYAQLFGSWKFRKPSEDVFQLGGVAVIDAAGTIAWLYRGEHPADYADVGEIVDVVKSLTDS